jgi:hypothetical protein
MFPTQLVVVAVAFAASCYLAVQVLLGTDRHHVVWMYITVSGLFVHLYLLGFVLLAAQAVFAVVLTRRAWFGIETSPSRWLEVQTVLWVVLLPTVYVREPAAMTHVLALG